MGNRSSSVKTLKRLWPKIFMYQTFLCIKCLFNLPSSELYIKRVVLSKWEVAYLPMLELLYLTNFVEFIFWIWGCWFSFSSTLALNHKFQTCLQSRFHHSIYEMNVKCLTKSRHKSLKIFCLSFQNVTWILFLYLCWF